MRLLLVSLRRISIALIVLYVAAVVAVWAVQERLVFVPPPVPKRQGQGAERVEYMAEDGQHLFAFLVGAPVSNASTLIIVFHGNGDLADSWIDWAKEVAHRTGWPVLLAEYRGYGGLAGRPSYKGTMADARAALKYAQTRFGITADHVVLYGHSLGSGVATQLAVEQNVRAVILESPITSVVDAGRRSFPGPIWWALPLISRIKFAPLSCVPKIDAPVWVAVGDRDDVAPSDMGRAVFAAAKRKGELLSVPDAGHGDVADRGGDRYWQWLARALSAP